MKPSYSRLVIVLLIAVLSFSHIKAQNSSGINEGGVGLLQSLSTKNIASSPDFGNTLEGAFLLSNIGGENFIGIRLQPEFTFGKVGIGVDIPLYISAETGKVRAELFDSWTTVLRIFRYVRYGQKKADDFYIKAGDLSGAYIGYGLLLSNYSNAYSEEKRKWGVEWDIRFNELFGIEGLYSHITNESFTTLALRGYFTPLKSSGIPIISSLEVGATYITDRDKTTTSTTPDLEDGADNPYNLFHDENGLSAFGIDAGITLLNTSFVRTTFNLQYAHMPKIEDTNLNAYIEEQNLNYKAGNGFSVGVDFTFNFVANVFALGTRLDYIDFSQNFTPQFFDLSFEQNKTAKVIQLLNTQAQAGWYGTLTGQILQTIILRGSLLVPNDISATNPALVNIEARMPELGPLSISGRYFKGGLASLGDAFDIEGAVANLRIGYRVFPYLVIGTDYYRTFAKNENGNYTFVDQVSPYVSFSLPL